MLTRVCASPRANRLNFVEFCYWLQGAIEIASLTGYDAEQVHKIQRKIEDVSEINGFVLGVKFVLSFYPPQEAFSYIYPDLQSMFLHEIDPTYEGDQEHLLAVHRGEEEPIYQGKKHE